MTYSPPRVALMLAAAFGAGWVTGAVVTGVALIAWASWPWIRRRLDSWRYVLEMAAP